MEFHKLEYFLEVECTTPPLAASVNALCKGRVRVILFYAMYPLYLKSTHKNSI